MYTSMRVTDALPAPGCPLAGHPFERAHLTGTPRLTLVAARNGERDGLRLGHPAWHPTPGFSPRITTQRHRQPVHRRLAGRPSRAQVSPAVDQAVPHGYPCT